MNTTLAAANAFLGTNHFIFLGISIEEREEQFQKAPSPILITLLGMYIDLIEEQL